MKKLMCYTLLAFMLLPFLVGFFHPMQRGAINQQQKAIVGPGDTWTANNATLSAQDGFQVAYWKAEDTADSIGVNTLANTGATFTAGKNNNAFTLNGSTQYLSASDSADFNWGSGDLTVSVWVFFSSVSQNSCIFNQGDTSANRLTIWWNNSTNVLSFQSFESSSWRLLYNIDFDPTISTWYHICMTRVGNTWETYINASTQTKTLDAGSYSNAMPDLTGNFVIGSRLWEPLYHNGKIDEFGIWKGYGADQAFVTALYNSGTGAFLQFPWLITLCFYRRKRTYKIFKNRISIR